MSLDLPCRNPDQRADPARLRNHPDPAGPRARRQAAPGVRAAAPGAAGRAGRAREASRRRRAAGLSGRDEGDPRRRLEDRADPEGPAVPPRRDHRPGRGQDGHQRVQFRRRYLHDRLRGQQLAVVVEPDPGPDQHRQGDPPHADARAEDRAGSKTYRLNEKVATLQVRPRGWHLDEKHVLVDGKRVHGGLFDFALFMFHNAKELVARGSGPYFYLPKIESYLEARLWNDVFVMAQNELGLPQGTIKATVLIETILAAFEMDEILYELREHSAGLNAGRWDYIFSCIKKFKLGPQLLPGRPRQGDDDGAVHAGLRAAAAEDLPQARRAGDRRHERADPDQERPGQERSRDGRHHRRQAPRCDRRLRRRLGRPPGPGRGRR